MLKRTVGSFVKGAGSSALVAPWQSGKAQLPGNGLEMLVREGYGKNELVFACVEEWATDIAEAQLQAYRNTPNGPEIVPNHPAVELWNNPNHWMSGDDLSGGVEMYKRLAGNAMLLKVRSGSTRPVELWLLRPDRVQVIPDANKYISGYQIQNGATVVKVPEQDVIHFKTRDPLNQFYGMPPLMAAAGRTDIDNFMKDIIKGFLRNSGVPAGILRLQGQQSDQEKALFRSRFRIDFGGDNSGNVMIVNGPKDSADYTPLAMPLGARGLVIPELDEIDEARIVMVFRVPHSVLGTRLGMSSSSYGNRKSDREEFTQRQLVPEWQYIASDLTRALLPEFGDADFLAFDLTTVQALQQDKDALSTRILAEVAGGVRTWQEGRKALGLQPDAAPDDTVLVPFQSTATPVRLLGKPPAQPVLPAPTEPSGNGTKPKVPTA